MAKQHTQPCKECPWRRISVRGWLGGKRLPQDWLNIAHGEVRAHCHKNLEFQCAGMAIYRANVCKSPKRPDIILQLPRNEDKVFAAPEEFFAHHNLKPGKKLEVINPFSII